MASTDDVSVQQEYACHPIVCNSNSVFFATAFCRADSDAADVVHLTPYRATAGFFDIACKSDLPSGKMVEAKVTWVAPKIKKLGVRIGDRLTTVDGKPLVDWSRSDFDSYMDAGLSEEKSAVFVFVGSRWLVRELTSTLTLKKELNHTAEPGSPK